MSNKINYITLKINLTETTVSVSTIKANKEEAIELLPGIQEYPINIEFDKNEIYVSQKEIKETTISGFMQPLFEHPEQFPKYSIRYQEKDYEVLAETLLTLVIYEFKKIVDTKGIINGFLLETPEGTNLEVIHRIKSALWNINIPNEYTPITEEYMIRPREDFYVDEEYIVYEIIQKEEQYLKCVKEIRTIERNHQNNRR